MQKLSRLFGGLFIFGFVHISCQTAQNPHRPVYQIKVKAGDTLSAIASRYGTTWWQIAHDNGIGGYGRIKVGDRLRVRPGPGGIVAEGTGKSRSSGFLGLAIPYAEDGKRTKGKKPSRPVPDSGGGLFFGGQSRTNILWPVHGKISSYFGPRWGRFHHGVDIKADRGKGIVSAADGRVVFVGWKKGYGRTLIIQHDNELSTLYGHCLAIHRKRGDRVTRGQTVARVGKTGNASGYHLHFEIRVREKPIDPMRYLPNRQISWHPLTRSLASGFQSKNLFSLSI